MTEYSKHEPGTFSWTDLSTTDLDAAIGLYTDLFGWEVDKQDIPAEAGGGVYARFFKNGKDVAAASTIRDEERAQGVPPHWNVYVTVEDAEQAAKQAEAAGGSIVAPTFDVMEFGRMAVVADPTGGMFNVWEPKTNIGAQLLQEEGALSWCELTTNDPDKAAKFYSEVFGYTAEGWGPDGSYTLLKRGDEMIAGVMKPQQEGWRPFWGIYFSTPEVDGIADKVKSAGGQIFMEPTDGEGVGRFAVLADPQGAAFGVVNPPQS